MRCAYELNSCDNNDVAFKEEEYREWTCGAFLALPPRPELAMIRKSNISTFIFPFRRTYTRVDQLLWYCGKLKDQGIDETPRWQDWSNRETTRDQKRIEGYLLNQDIDGKAILHIGIGNSELAHNLTARKALIDGITIQENELNKAEKMNVNNYRVFLHNKYDKELRSCLGRTYDYIVDNNPTSFACCRKHLFVMMKSYYKLLNKGGLLITDKLGLGWVTPTNIEEWGLKPEEWAQLGQHFGFTPIHTKNHVIVLEKR